MMMALARHVLFDYRVLSDVVDCFVLFFFCIMMSSDQGVGMLGPPRRVPVKGTALLSGEDPRALGPLGDSDDSPRLAQIQDGWNPVSLLFRRENIFRTRSDVR